MPTRPGHGGGCHALPALRLHCRSRHSALRPIRLWTVQPASVVRALLGGVQENKALRPVPFLAPDRVCRVRCCLTLGVILLFPVPVIFDRLLPGGPPLCVLTSLASEVNVLQTAVHMAQARADDHAIMALSKDGMMLQHASANKEAQIHPQQRGRVPHDTLRKHIGEMQHSMTLCWMSESPKGPKHPSIEALGPTYYACNGFRDLYHHICLPGPAGAD